MVDPEIMVANERWKSISRTLFQFGAVLASAAAVELYRDAALTMETVAWSMGASALMFAGWKVLILLEPEK